MLSWKSSAWLLALAASVQHVLAQNPTPTQYTDPDTGIIFSTWRAIGQASMRLGVSLPADALTVDADEYIGLLECGTGDSEGWCGLSLGGGMNTNLLLTAYPYEGEVHTAFKWSTGYGQPVPYQGDATLTQISSSVNSTHFRLIYRCQGCLSWSHEGTTGGNPTSGGFMLLGWALGTDSPSGRECPENVQFVQHNYQGIFGAGLVAGTANAEYAEWAELADGNPPNECGGGGPDPPTTTTTAAPTGTPVPTGTSYDYIVVGAGAGGIPIADKLSEAGHSVLLIEKGPPSSGRWGGSLKPEWLEGTNLTRFDVPGLCNEIWVNSDGVACRDTDQMAGCVLGGGTAVNAGLWWKPNPTDWDYNFPSGWKASDMTAATNRVFSRIPGTTTPSTDGRLYLQQGYDLISGGLQRAGWSFVDANANPGRKNRTYAHTPYMFSNGERGGPMATYLVSANSRNNFDLWTGTQVRRLIRTGGHITGVQVEPYINGGYVGTVGTTAITGRVIVAAGTFGSARLLLRSGIGPRDQLLVVNGSSTDGATFIGERSWINLPVGYNLEDHTNTDLVFTHPSIVHYDFYEAYDDPIPADEQAYLGRRQGILAQAAPNIGPLFFEEIRGTDNIVRQLQWTARVEGGHDVPNGQAMVVSQYLGRGAVSRGRMTLSNALTTEVSVQPYLSNSQDEEAVIRGIENLQSALSSVANLTWQFPAAGTSAREHVLSYPKLSQYRRANHWIGTNKMSTRDGRVNNGDGVVDTNTKVYGTDNLFVVDGSIFPGMVTTNPSSYIVIAAEHAAQKILSLRAPTPAARYAQCGGREYNGAFQCASGSTCTYVNDYYWQCL
uniref:Cellobiose dehydrogenase n=1 Tax=Stachybotrys bisbyi TaxID=80385 RepID=E7D6C5_STABI|nr:cellobiose dehydrogenase [Stachybotrys bisbyi]